MSALPIKKRPWREQLVHALGVHRIDAVIDVGANRGQYATGLRRAGWCGPIVSFEPLPDLRDALAATAAADPAWTVAPAMALGDRDAVAVLERSAESDMSSLLPRTALLERISPSSAVVERLEVPLRRLDGLAMLTASPWRRMLVKLDVQGGEAAVLDGATGLWDRIAALQLELALVPLYRGETPWRVMVDRLAAEGFSLGLVIPGYYEQKLGRQLQFDGVFVRASL